VEGIGYDQMKCTIQALAGGTEENHKKLPFSEIAVAMFDIGLYLCPHLG
jgi:hypothetical protein